MTLGLTVSRTLYQELYFVLYRRGLKFTPMFDNEPRSFRSLQKKCSGKLESFVDKLIKNNKTLIFYNQNKYLSIFQHQESTLDSTQTSVPLRP